MLIFIGNMVVHQEIILLKVSYPFGEKILAYLLSNRTGIWKIDSNNDRSRYYDERIFETWFEIFLLSALGTPSVIIMDNARFH